MKQPKISIIIVTWNGQAYIEKCLDSIFNQILPSDYQKRVNEFFDILIIDNNSVDKTVQIIAEKYGNNLTIVKNKQNVGFAKAYNQGIHWTSGRYVLLLNQDVYLAPNFFSHLTIFLDTYPKVAAVNPLIYKWLDNHTTKVIDSMGLGFDKKFRFINLGEGEVEINKQKEIKPVFGFTGTAVALRRSALYDVAYDREFFDELFISYKEDIDLSWRLRWRNWDIVNLPEAVVFHKRTAARQKGDLSLWEKKNRYQTKPYYINYYSYRNHLITLIKNLSLRLFLLNFFYLLVYESKKMIFLMIFQPQILFKSWFDIFKNFKIIKEKRRYIFKTKKIKSAGIALWLKQNFPS